MMLMYRFWLVGTTMLFAMAIHSNSSAQSIVFDGSVGRQGNITGPQYLIKQEDGLRRGEKLFHSFTDFNLRSGESVLFESSTGVSTIFSRVTGVNESSIDGLIRTQSQNVDLFLINPRGIFFGPEAQLDIGGSFLASTADSIVFEGDMAFSASNPQEVPLLNMSMPSGLQTGELPGIIQSQSRNATVGLEVSAGQSLTLLGSDVILDGGILTAESGRVELGSVSGTSFVSLEQDFQGWALGYSDVSGFRNITLSDFALIQTSNFTEGNGLGPGFIPMGKVHLQGHKVEILDNSGIVSFAGEQPFQSLISINAKQLSIQEGSEVRVTSFGDSNAGEIVINSDLVEINGRGFNNADSRLTAEARGESSQGGQISLEGVEFLSLRNGAVISAGAENMSGSGNIDIDAKIIFAIATENSDIIANSVDGVAGQINITTQGLFGLKVNDALTGASDITAFSSNDPSLNGQVIINTPETDPSDSTAELSERIDIPPKLAQVCRAGQALGNGQFANVGNGGLPPTPNGLRSYHAVWHDLRPPEIPLQASKEIDLPLATSKPNAHPIIEANGWVATSKGLMLVAPKQASSTSGLTASGGC